MTDALLSSTLIPLGVNVIRLAATEDEEGIAVMARTIVVRYVSSSVTVTNLSPLATERVMTFEVTLAAQSYLTQSGHDYVTQMCAGCYNTLNNQVPMDCGVEVLEPLHLSQENFQGLTDNSQYVYTQTWSLTAQEINSVFAMDPCVQRGNCSYLFPSEYLSTVLPGDVLYSNLLYAPVLPPPAGLDYDPEFCGVEVKGDDLVYKTDTNMVFLRDWTKYNLVSTGTFTTTGDMLVVNIYEKETNKLIGDYLASNCGGRGLIQIAGNQPARNGNFIGGLYTSRVDQAGNPTASSGEVLTPVFAQKNGYGYVNVIRATVYTDPTIDGQATATVKYGQLYTYQEGTELMAGGQKYLYIGGTPIGKAWIREIDFRVVKYDPGQNCTGPNVEPGIPEGANKDNTGPLESCE